MFLQTFLAAIFDHFDPEGLNASIQDVVIGSLNDSFQIPQVINYNHFGYLLTSMRIITILSSQNYFFDSKGKS